MLYPGRRGRVAALLKRDFFSDALRLLELSHRASSQHEEALARWTRAFDGEEPRLPRDGAGSVAAASAARRRPKAARPASRRSAPDDDAAQA